MHPSHGDITKALVHSQCTPPLDYKGTGWCPTLCALHLHTMKPAAILRSAMASFADKESAMFDFFNHGSRAYERRAETMLREARFAQL